LGGHQGKWKFWQFWSLPGSEADQSGITQTVSRYHAHLTSSSAQNMREDANSAQASVRSLSVSIVAMYRGDKV
jgi:hypothetical protein